MDCKGADIVVAERLEGFGNDHGEAAPAGGLLQYWGASSVFSFFANLVPVCPRPSGSGSGRRVS